MIDLHTHILPGIDDGAENLQESIAMIGMERTSGVNKLFLTPHFYPEEADLPDFLSVRSQSWSSLKDSLGDENMHQIRLGAEVRYCPQLLSLELSQLTLEHSSYLLLELPGQWYPAYLPETMEKLLEDGFFPILAHVERCSYFRNEPALLKRLADMGVLAQVSAGALFDRKDRKFSLACLEHHLAQIVASDAHNTGSRKPCMELLKKIPEELQQFHHKITGAVWDNEVTPYFRTSDIRKSVFHYC